MSDKVNVDQFRSILYRPTPKLANTMVDYELAVRDPKTSTHHSIPREELVDSMQKNINRYRAERDAGPKGIVEHKATVIKNALRNK